MRKPVRITLIILFFVVPFISFGQLVFHQETFRGGTTGAGFSTALGSGSGTFNIYIEPGSIIKKAWLFGQRQGYPEPATIILNSNNYVFDSSLVVTAVSQSGVSSVQCSPLAVDVIDITNDINPTVLNYNITIPVTSQNAPYPCWGYSAFYLLVLYENNSLPLHHSAVLLNNKQIVTNTFFNVSNINPINTIYPVGFAVFSDRIGINAQNNDGSFVYLNSNLLGVIKGSDGVNSLWSGAGVKGHFYYQNNTLFGLDDDTPDSLMNGTDGLADVKSYLNFGDTAFNYLMQYQIPNNHTNLYNAWFLTYTTPCDTFTTSITANDTICFGDSIQLNATGGSQYSWFGAFGGVNDTSIANPKASPPQTTTYIVTITNDSSCVKTEHVKIWVNPVPVADTLIVTNNVCGDSSGVVNVGNISNGYSPFTYTLTSLQTTNTKTQNTNVFSGLGTGVYELLIIDSNGCQWLDTVTINEVNNVVANFTATPSSGVAPLDVSFSNTSIGANNFEWIITNANGDTVYWIPFCTGMTVNCGFQYLFDSSGTYEVCLIAYNNLPHCADTICKTIVVEDEISLIIPNVFTPNGDGENDNFVIQLTGASLIKSLKAEIYNRWGMLIKDFKLEINNSTSNLQSPISNLTIWDGYTTAAVLAPEGTYFYVISYETLDGETKTEKGSLTLLR